MKKLAKDINNISRAFTTDNTQLQKLEEADSDLSDSEDEDEASHFQMAGIDFGKSDFQFAQLVKKFDPHIAIPFNYTAGCNVGYKTKINLREVILIDIQSTMDIFCNRALVEKTTDSKTKMRLKSNGVTMTVSHQATVKGYHNSVWFSENYITDIIVLRNLRIQYLVTYRRDDMMIMVYR